MQTFTIGRDASNQIVLNDNLVSRHHAQLTMMDNGQVMIKDLGSSNGTYVNGNRITECYLNAGDIVKCGSVFLNWSQYILRSPQPAQQMNYQQSQFNDPANQEQFSDSGTIQYGLGSVFKYLTTRILDIGDLFKTNWKKTSSILFLYATPVLITLIISLLYYLKTSYIKFSIYPAILAIFTYGLSPFIAVYLLSLYKKVTIDKVALASGIIGFITFSFVTMYSLPALLNLNSNIPFLNFNVWFFDNINVFHGAITMLIVFLIICMILSLFIFIFRYFISTGFNRSASIYLVIGTLVTTYFFQFLFSYLFFLILKNTAKYLLL